MENHQITSDANISQFLKGDIGAGVVVVAMGEMRLEVIVDGGVQRRGVAVPRQASISNGGRPWCRAGSSKADASLSPPNVAISC